MQPGRNLEPLFGQFDGRQEELFPGQNTVRPVRHLQHPHQPRHADAAPACLAHAVRDRLTCLVEQQRFRGGRRRGFAPVIGLEDGAASLVRIRRGVIQQKGAAADPRTLRLHQREDHLGGDRGIDGAAARPQNVPPHPCGMRIGGRNHMLLSERRRDIPCATGRADGCNGAEQQDRPMDGFPLALFLTEHLASLKTAFICLFMRQRREQAKEILSWRGIWG